MTNEELRQRAIQCALRWDQNSSDLFVGSNRRIPIVMAAIKPYEEEVERLRSALSRPGSMEAFHVATAHVPEEVKQRVQFAREALDG